MLGPTDYTETSVKNYHHTLHNMPEERRSQMRDVLWNVKEALCNWSVEFVILTGALATLTQTIYTYMKVKVKWCRYRPGVAQRVGSGIALLFHDRSTRRGEWSAARPGRTLPPGKTRYPLYRRLGGPQGRFGRTENLVPIGIRSRTVQPVASHYTDWATKVKGKSKVHPTTGHEGP